MNSSERVMLLAARYLTFASVVSVMFSIAISQILLGLAIAALLFSEARLRLPPIWLPLGLFVLGTLVSLAVSNHPELNNPQVRKIFVFFQLLVVFSTLRNFGILRRLYFCLFGAGALVALRALVQFREKVGQARAAGQNFYEYYVTERITGTMSHWMTFGGQEMFILLMVGAYLFFASSVRRRGFWLVGLSGAVIAVALLLGFTRTIWGASAVAGLYLLWVWKRPVALLAPLALLVVILVAPVSVRTRAASMIKPKKGIDSNEFRYVCRRIGYEMIRAHPWFGVGPQQVERRYNSFVPADVPRPLPEGWYSHLHNLYIHYAAERGIPTMLALLWLLAKVLFDFARGIRKLPPGRSDRKFLLHGGIAVVIATMAAGLFELNLGDSEVLTLFLAIVASGYVTLEASEVA